MHKLWNDSQVLKGSWNETGPEKAEAYTTAINQYVEKGFAEGVLDLTSEDGSVRYLLHHAVFRADTDNKM